jgi:VanZ family protein
MILGFSIYKAVSHEVKNNYLKFILSLAFVMAIGLEDEILQSYLPNRDMELSDLFRDFLGGLAGVLLGMIAENGKNKQVKKKLTNPRK